MKNPKSEIRMTKETRGPNVEKLRPPWLGTSGFGLRHSLIIRHSSFVIALLLLGFGFPFSAFSQSYSIDWFTIDGGGGTSTGGVYAVSGTIGQPDAGGPMTNGQYSLLGGFWALPTAVQTMGAPMLTIAPAAPGQATISWTPNTPGFLLQESASLSPINWTNSPSAATNPVAVPATLPKKFYRLFKP